MSASNRYTFGDSDLAAARLRLVADVFGEPSRAFLARLGIPRPEVALDLGCGPGESTRLLAEVLGPRHIVGIDGSAHFVARAEAAGIAGARFVVADVTELPLTGAPADLIHVRLLLAHLPDPAALVAAWCSQLTGEGVLAVDEVEWIRTDHPVLARYEEVVVALVASRGGLMYAGPVLGALAGGDGWRVRSNAVAEHPVPVPVAARIFAMNMEVWRTEPFIRANYTDATLDDLAADLTATASAESDVSVSWGLRQATFMPS